MKLTLSMCKYLVCYVHSVVIKTAYRDCLRFSFMDLLQKELNDVRYLWNIHLIRHRRSPAHITGVPDELYYIPQLRGMHVYYNVRVFKK